MTLVLCAAGHNAEFQRQVAIPIVPKVSSAILAIAEKHNDQDIKVSSRHLTGTTRSLPAGLVHTCAGTISAAISLAPQSTQPETIRILSSNIQRFCASRDR